MSMDQNEMSTMRSSRIPIWWIWPLVLLCSWCVLLRLQSPTIGMGDSGETVSAIMTLGVSHPPGHPLGELLGRIAILLPLGSIAFRVNLMSVFAVLLSAWLLGRLVGRRLLVSGVCHEFASYFWAILAFLTLVFNPLVLEQALSAKGSVYTLSLLWSVCVLCSLPMGRTREDWDIPKVFFWMGLSFATHWPTALVGSAIVVAWIWGANAGERRYHLMSFLGLGVGWTVYLLLPMRAMAFPPIDWGHAVSWDSFWWLLTRANYSEMETAGRNMTNVIHQIGVTIKTLFFCFPWAFLSFVGYAYWWKQGDSNFRVFVIGMAVPAMAIAIVPTLNPETYFLIPVYLTAFLGLWTMAALTGMAVLFHHARSWNKIIVFLFGLIIVMSWVLFFSAVPTRDASRNLLAHDIGVNVLQALPRNAVLLGEGDTYVLSLLHAKWVEGLRPDVKVIPTVFLNGAWGFDQAIREIRPRHTPPYAPTTFGERIGFLTSLGAPVVGEPEKDVYISSLSGALQKANLASFIRFEPWGLSFRLSSRPSDPMVVRERVWEMAVSQRKRGSFDARKDIAIDRRNREIYGYYANPFILSGNALHESGRLLEASDDYSRALKFLPDSAEAYSNLAAVAGASGLHELAKVFCDMALEVDPDYAGAWDNLGNVYSLQGHWNEALDAYDRALTTKPDSPATRVNRDRALQSQKEGRIGTVQRHDVKWYMDMGVEYYKQQRWVMALGVFRTVLDFGMDTPGIWSNIGVVKAQLGDLKGARLAFENALDLLEKGRGIQPSNAEINALMSTLAGASQTP
jgi:Flp pilus assembly protein TadD